MRLNKESECWLETFLCYRSIFGYFLNLHKIRSLEKWVDMLLKRPDFSEKGLDSTQTLFCIVNQHIILNPQTSCPTPIAHKLSFCNKGNLWPPDIGCSSSGDSVYFYNLRISTYNVFLTLEKHSGPH